MSRAYFDDLAPELILLLSPLLSTGSLNALASTCHRIHQVLQPELDARITPVKSRQLLLWASAASKPRVVAKLLSPPYSLHPDLSVGYCSQTPLHVAAIGGNIEVARMLLDSGASTEAQQDDAVHQPLHLAVMHKHLDMVRLLLDHGAPIDTTFGSDGVMQTAFQYACWAGDLDTVKLLLEGGAGLERPQGHFGTALGFAVQARRLDIVRFLLENGADATVSIPLGHYGTELGFAVHGRKLDIVRLLLEKAPTLW
ncbi:ankyrin repeat-containing domain protein [Mycena galopus ATCC 62051]|nr:ankyrin repeat-containing domain protein [Mycena galopus ATCC 62051]